MFTAKARIKNLLGGTTLSRLSPLAKKGARVKVGFPAGDVDGGVIDRAFYNEFGTRGSGKGFKTERGGGFGGPIPERPFMRNAMRDNESKYRANMVIAGQHITEAIAKGADPSVETRRALSKLGIMAQADIQEEITALSSPPNSPTTIRLKGSSNPLIDSGEMRSSVTWKVEE